MILNKGGRSASGLAAAGLAAAMALWAAPAVAPCAEIPITHPEVIEARKQRDRGEFARATQTLTRLRDASTTLSDEMRRAVDLEIEKIRRTRKDHPATRAAVLKALRERIRDFSEAELDQAIAAGDIRPMAIDGKEMFFSSSVSNLLLRRPDLDARRIKPSTDQSLRRLLEAARAADAAATTGSGPYVSPRDWQATITLTVPPGNVPAGQLIRAWLPYPQEGLPYQTSVTLVSSDPPGGLVAPAEAPQRTIYLERMAVADTTATLQASYTFRTFDRVFRPDAAQVRNLPSGQNAEWREHLRSRPPHLDLADPKIRETANAIVGQTTNPLEKARLIHEWMVENLIYQYAREYSTLDNIARHTLDNKAGDCGQHGMLFIALCRAAGVPARWTSGWEMFEKDAGLHDWTEIWIEPYGWIPVDTDMAILAVRHRRDQITGDEAKWLANFFLGNMDGLRLTVNVDYGRPLVPPKRDFRSETVDFQRGEVEADGKNLYFDQWDYDMEIRPLDP